MVFWWCALALVLAAFYMVTYTLLRTSGDGRPWYRRLRRPDGRRRVAWGRILCRDCSVGGLWRVLGVGLVLFLLSAGLFLLLFHRRIFRLSHGSPLLHVGRRGIRQQHSRGPRSSVTRQGGPGPRRVRSKSPA